MNFNSSHFKVNKLLDESFHAWLCSLVVSCLTCDHKVGGSIRKKQHY